MLAAALVAYGVYTAVHAKLDVFPDFVQPQATIQTESPGLSPEQVEALVTRPVESAVNGVSRIEAVRSQSIQGLSIVIVVFKEGTDIFTARQMLTERLGTLAERLPAGVKAPKLTPLTSSTMDLLKIGLISDKLSPMELRAFADWTLKPRLQAVEGVADVGVMGGEVKQLQIQIHPDRLVSHGLSIEEVVAAAKQATGTRGGGFIETANQRVVIQPEGQMLTPEQLGQVVVSHRQGANLLLKDVADVVIAPEPKFGDVTIMGRPGVLVKLLSQYGSNTMEVTRAVEKALDEMEPAFKAQGIDTDKRLQRLHRPATFIEVAIRHVRYSLFLGAILVVIVLFLFLFNLRTAFISITAIPLSLLTAIIVLQWFGMTLNTITLGGLAIAIGEVVDDAIIDVENIFRRLKENKALGYPRSAFRVVLDASVEVRSAVVYATFVVVLVFVPVLTMSGLQGRMFAPLGVAYILAILASLAVALTVTPALCMVLLPRAANWAREPFFIRWIKSGYAWLIGHLTLHPRPVVGFAIILVIGTVTLLLKPNQFGGEFLPEFREGHFVLQVSNIPGTSLHEMLRTGKNITRALLEDVKVDGKPAIDTVEHQIGRAELGEDPWGPHRSEFHLELKPDTPGAQQSEVQEQIRELLKGYGGMNSEVLTFLGDRISETITGETSPVVINLFGDDLDALDEKAQEIQQVISGIDGAADVKVASPPGSPQVVAQLRPDRLREYGFSPVEVLDAIETAYQGTSVTQGFEANRSFDVVVILPPERRQDPEAIGGLLLRNSSGTTVRLDQLADIYPRTGRYMVSHEGSRRRQAVTCNVEGRDLAAFVAEARQKVAEVSKPKDMYVDFAGTAEARESARRELLLHSSLAGLGVLLLLGTVFGIWRNLNLLLVLANLPFALVGGVLAVWLTGVLKHEQPSLSVGSMVGFVTLFGITMRNSVMMISHYEHLVAQEGMTWGLAAAVRGASERIVPVLMTALVTGLGLLPIALGTGEVGREIEGPMAVVILGGLVTSTALNLLILPTLALWFGKFEPHVTEEEIRAEAPPKPPAPALSTT